MKRSKFLLNSLFIIFFTTQIIVSEQDSTEVIQIQTNEAVTPVGPFSQAMLVKNPKELLFIAGQLPVDPVTNILANDPAQAVELCMKNLLAILKAAGMDFSNVVKTTILLKDIKDFATVNEVYKSFLQEPYPARLTFQAADLPKNACVEIEMIAVGK